jgi:hypothetical protein
MLAIAIIKDKITHLEELVETLAIRVKDQTEMIKGLRDDNKKLKENLQRRVPTIKQKNAKS